MTKPRVWVVKTGSANLASVCAGLRRLGADPVLTEEPKAIVEAQQAVLPGVGALGATKTRLDELGLSPALSARLRAGRPTLAVCLGLQLLLEGSDESPDAAGLGVVPGWARRFPSDVRVPHLGWNRVVAPDGARYLETGDYYFANSFRLQTPPPDVRSAETHHGGPFVAAFERGGLLACQFHPELSGSVGSRVLQRWLEESPRLA